MTTNEELEALYGKPAQHSEYSIGQTIRYHRTPGDIRMGEISYVCAPSSVCMRDGRTVDAPLSYVVAPDDGGMQDIVYNNEIIPDQRRAKSLFGRCQTQRSDAQTSGTQAARQSTAKVILSHVVLCKKEGSGSIKKDGSDPRKPLPPMEGKASSAWKT